MPDLVGTDALSQCTRDREEMKEFDGLRVRSRGILHLLLKQKESRKKNIARSLL
jgi:hypothetical protein